MRIRVLRLLEYIYDSAETMERDMSRWGVGAQATHRAHSEMEVRSSTLPLSFVPDAGPASPQTRQALLELLRDFEPEAGREPRADPYLWADRILAAVSRG